MENEQDLAVAIINHFEKTSNDSMGKRIKDLMNGEMRIAEGSIQGLQTPAIGFELVNTEIKLNRMAESNVIFYVIGEIDDPNQVVRKISREIEEEFKDISNGKIGDIKINGSNLEEPIKKINDYKEKKRMDVFSFLINWRYF